NTAVVSVSKAFGEQIKVIVKSVQNPAISASVICDYNAQVLGGSINLSHVEGGHSSAGAWNFSMPDFTATNTAVTVSDQHTGTHRVDYSVSFSDGTKTPEAANNYISVYLANTSFYDAITAGHTLLKARSDIGSIAMKTSAGVEIAYERDDEINLDLPGIDLLTDATKTLIIESRDYMLGYTSETPNNWDNGETYAAYCQIMNGSNADLSGKITLHVEDGKLAGDNCYTNLVWKKGYFNCPILSITLDETRLEF
ncbi:MAG: hypothetical protein IJW60_04330, partial [Clostridia bacterium]|nr:hypothetical protein [Clostridia bacterium]